MTAGPSRVIPGAHVIATRLDDGDRVLLDTASTHYIRLNRTATVIWMGIEAGDDGAAIARRLIEAFEVDPERARESVEAFTETLLEHGLAEKTHE